MSAGQGMSPEDVVTLSRERLLELRAQEVDLGAPTTATGIDRPDGVPGLTEAMANVELLPPQVAQARTRLEQAVAGGNRQEIADARQGLADAAGLELRDTRTVAMPPRVGDRAAAELVVADVLNLSARGTRRSLLDGDLVEAYEDTLRVAIALRALIERNRQATAGQGDVLGPPPLRNGSVIARDGVAWQLRDGTWEPVLPTDDLDEETRAAVEAHTGPLAR